MQNRALHAAAVCEDARRCAKAHTWDRRNPPPAPLRAVSVSGTRVVFSMGDRETDAPLSLSWGGPPRGRRCIPSADTFDRRVPETEASLIRMRDRSARGKRFALALAYLSRVGGAWRRSGLPFFRLCSLSGVVCRVWFVGCGSWWVDVPGQNDDAGAVLCRLD